MSFFFLLLIFQPIHILLFLFQLTYIFQRTHNILPSKAPSTRAVSAAAARAGRLSFTLTPMGAFTQSQSVRTATLPAAPCRTASKTAAAEMPHSSFGGHVLLWARSHVWCLPRAARDSCLSTLAGRARDHFVCIIGKAGMHYIFHLMNFQLMYIENVSVLHINSVYLCTTNICI